MPRERRPARAAARDLFLLRVGLLLDRLFFFPRLLVGAFLVLGLFLRGLRVFFFLFAPGLVLGDELVLLRLLVADLLHLRELRLHARDRRVVLLDRALHLLLHLHHFLDLGHGVDFSLLGFELRGHVLLFLFHFGNSGLGVGDGLGLLRELHGRRRGLRDGLRDRHRGALALVALRLGLEGLALPFLGAEVARRRVVADRSK